MQEVVGGLFLGGQGAEMNKDLLKASGITHILGLNGKMDPSFPEVGLFLCFLALGPNILTSIFVCVCACVCVCLWLWCFHSDKEHMFEGFYIQECGELIGFKQGRHTPGNWRLCQVHRRCYWWWWQNFDSLVVISFFLLVVVCHCVYFVLFFFF